VGRAATESDADQDADDRSKADARRDDVAALVRVLHDLGKEPGSAQVARAERIKNDPRWRFFELSTGHNLHYSAPSETVAILLELAKMPARA
jgi:hypothetical protein